MGTLTPYLEVGQNLNGSSAQRDPARDREATSVWPRSYHIESCDAAVFRFIYDANAYTRRVLRQFGQNVVTVTRAGRPATEYVKVSGQRTKWLGGVFAKCRHCIQTVMSGAGIVFQGILSSSRNVDIYSVPGSRLKSHRKFRPEASSGSQRLTDR